MGHNELSVSLIHSLKLNYRYINIFKSTDISNIATLICKSELAFYKQAVEIKLVTNTQSQLQGHIPSLTN